MAEIFDRIAIIGIGLIGSSIARALKENGVCREIVVGDINAAHGKPPASARGASSRDQQGIGKV